VILVEGLFDLAVLWQAGFLNTSSAFGIHLTAMQPLTLPIESPPLKTRTPLRNQLLKRAQ
jgi:hypothetical protein